MFNPADIKQKTALCRSPQLGGLAERALGDAAYLRGFCGRPLLAVLGDLFEPDGLLVDKVAIDPAILDHEVQHTSEDRGVASGFYGPEQIARARDGCDPRVLDDHLRPEL